MKKGTKCKKFIANILVNWSINNIAKAASHKDL